MCNRYRIFADKAALAAFGVVISENLSPLPGELFPKRTGVVVRRDDEPLVLNTMSGTCRRQRRRDCQPRTSAA